MCQNAHHSPNPDKPEIRSTKFEMETTNHITYMADGQISLDEESIPHTHVHIHKHGRYVHKHGLDGPHKETY